MDYKELIEKYFAGESTLEEEAQLKAYFRDPQNVAESLKGYAPLFQFFEQEGTQQLAGDFDEKLLAKLEPPSARRFRLNPLRIAAAAAIAAVALIAATVFYCESKPKESAPVATIDWSKYEPKTTEEAYEITRSALRRASDGLNIGTKMAIENLEKVSD